MIPWVLLDRTDVPGGGELRLLQRGSEFSIRLSQGELMNSRLSGSEEALAVLACARIASRPRPRVLIGGLGMGFTLAAALTAVGPEARITVAELVPAIIAWAKGPLAALCGASLVDPRVTLTEGDVGRLVRCAAAHYDAILLDVDNGPDGLTRSANDRLYAADGLDAARRALRPGGILAVWSAAADAGFTKRLSQAGFTVEEHRVRASRRGRGARHTIWIASRRREG